MKGSHSQIQRFEDTASFLLFIHLVLPATKSPYLTPKLTLDPDLKFDSVGLKLEYTRPSINLRITS